MLTVQKKNNVEALYSNVSNLSWGQRSYFDIFTNAIYLLRHFFISFHNDTINFLQKALTVPMIMRPAQTKNYPKIHPAIYQGGYAELKSMPTNKDWVWQTDPNVCQKYA